MRISVLLFLSFAWILSTAQSNTWTKTADGFPGVSLLSLTLYSPQTKEFVLNFGGLSEEGINCRYQVQVYTDELSKWINALPHDSLYGSTATADVVDSAAGNWADSIGYAYGRGRVGLPVFRTYFWTWGTVDGYLRPSSVHGNANAYGQGCYDSDNGKFYYYLSNTTISYDPATRLFDTISTATHPNSGAVEGFLKWGSMVYDASNQEILLFGGCGLDQPYGSPMTWTFKPATGVWTKRNLAVQPPPRANSPLVYDAANEVIVLFGGDRLDAILNDTWVYECATRTWVKRVPAISPKPRAGHGLYYLPKQGKIALMGGYRYAANQASEFEIWTYDVPENEWGLVKRFASGDTRPSQPGLYALLYYTSACDTGDNIIALADESPSVYSFQPSTFRLHCDVSVIDGGGTLTYGATSDTLVHTGIYYETSFGIANDPAWFTEGVAEPDTAVNEAYLRGIPLSTWVELTPPRKPGGHRDWGTAILDTDRDIILTWSGGHVAHCGTDVPQYSIANDRWQIGYWPEYPLEWDGYNFPSPGPFTFTNRPFMPCHTVKSYAYDVNLRKMVFAYDNHTWIYDPEKMDWDSVNIHNPWGGGWGYHSGMVNTPHGVFNWFGDSYRTCRPYLFDTASMGWTALTPTGDPFPGFYADAHGVVYDGLRDRVLWFGGTSVYAYTFTDNRCTLLHPSDSGLMTAAAVNAGYLRECAYLPAQDIVLFAPSAGVSGELAYDCAGDRLFVAQMAGTSSDGGVATGLMYDPRRDLVWHKDNYRDKIFVLRVDSNLTGLDIERQIPGDTVLTTVPNPFNPVVAIRLPGALKGAGVRVFDLSGRLVADLKADRNGKQAVWDASNRASGVYVVAASKGGLTVRRKITLLK